VTDLKGELASLKIDRAQPASSPWRWPLLFFVPAVLLIGSVYALRAKQAFSTPEVATATALVTTGATGGSQGAPLLTASGYVVARRQAVVSAKIQGRLSERLVEEGSRVKKGDLLARLEDVDYQASVVKSRAAVQRAEADLAENRRQLRLNEKLAVDGVVSVDQRDAAASRVQLADATLAQAKADLVFVLAQLANTEIRAPFSGVVVKKMAEVGESVAPIPPGVNLSTSSGAIVALADLDTLEVEADVAEANVSKLTDAQPAQVAVEAVPDRRYRAVLRQVIPTADRTKATVQVKVTILDKDKDLRPEMSATVTFLERETKTAGADPPARPLITVPREVIVTRDGKSIVFEIRDGKAVARAIVTGLERGGQIVVRDGLAGGETLVRQPPDTLKDGDAVKVKG
jgi:RND family efflux transporter MFP subunit